MYLSVTRGLRAKDYSIQEAGFQILSVLAYAILFKVILSGREPAYSIEGEGQKHEGARHITGNTLILLGNFQEDYSIQEAEGGGQMQGISLVMSSFSSEIEDYSI